MKKLQILLNTNTISQSVFKKCSQVFEYCVEWNEEDKDRFITHLAMALMRVEKNESVDKMNELLSEQILSNNSYEKANSIFDELFSDFHIQINENEKAYILVHLINALERK